ncbi:1-deoxy-D-xylulose-5-phosphate synthase [Fluviicoccus keumensis]|uniref:1-deoxy-D-xylulose-5-phosphate synthase n=1 Tax=Fluviicoccus keumensis TaxID=1435465 RepID=A0A4V6MG13_9GAMM|nr:1-deoxy-D-xylulose-5-phosphate synthase [Fluviicoccus keumensis]RZU47746.1 1-deoxy-D-xylulose-5-phosphate synthase [Fluviicoccus keumensis]
MFHSIPLTRPLTPLLDQAGTPDQLRRLPETALPALARELREYLLWCTGQTGGHFGAGLGVIELTIALHYVYNTPEDRLVWDVGHQAYPHKILTGRKEQMLTMRHKDGLAAFPRREESPYDTFGVGHSSTSISAALGMALAARRQLSGRKVAAVIGDGAMTAGMAFEALNDAAHHAADMLVILNDNAMSISHNVGGLSNYLARIWSSRSYIALREGGKKVLASMPSAWNFARRTEESMKHLVSSPGALFEAIGFNYVGPIDGHNLEELVQVIRNLKHAPGPQLLHVYTTKGKGFSPAEADPIGYHAITKIAPANQRGQSPAPKLPKYSDIFGDWLCDMAAADHRLIGITPAMCEGSGMVRFARQFPDRYHDVAIAEQHAVTLAAGMACEGLKPVVAIYSTFLQRGYDQLVHDVALQNLDVTFGIDRAGLVGEDGPTHAGAYDYAYMRTIPNMVILAPADENECRQMLYTAYQHPGPAAVRYPRGTGPGVAIENAMTALPFGRGEVRRQGQRVALLSFGSLLAAALKAADALDATVANMRWVKPLDGELVRELAATHDLLVTLEEHAVMGGAGSAVNEWLAQAGITRPVLNLGIPDAFIEHAAHGEMLAACGLDAAGIEQAVRRRLAALS